MKAMVYSKTYQATRRRQIFKQGLAIEQQLQGLFPTKSKEELRHLVSNCRRYLDSKNIILNPEAIVVLEFLQAQGLNPRTVYRWLRYIRLPEDLKIEIEHGTLNKRKAIQLMNHKQDSEKVSLDWRFLGESKKIIKEVLHYV